MSEGIATVQASVDELLQFQEENIEVLEGLESNGNGGFSADNAEIRELLVDSLTVDTISVLGSSGNKQQIFGAEIFDSTLKNSTVIGKGVDGIVNNDNMTYFKMMRITSQTTAWSDCVR